MFTQERTLAEHRKLVEGIMKRDQRRRKRIEAAGIDYECPEIVRIYIHLLSSILLRIMFNALPQVEVMKIVKNEPFVEILYGEGLLSLWLFGHFCKYEILMASSGLSLVPKPEQS